MSKSPTPLARFGTRIYLNGSASSFNVRDCPNPEGLAELIVRAANAHDVLFDVAKNVAAFDDSLLVSSNLNLLRATLREFRDTARGALAQTERHDV